MEDRPQLIRVSKQYTFCKSTEPHAEILIVLNLIQRRSFEQQQLHERWARKHGQHKSSLNMMLDFDLLVCVNLPLRMRLRVNAGMCSLQMQRGGTDFYAGIAAW